MTVDELAVVRDRVARARLDRHARLQREAHDWQTKRTAERVRARALRVAAKPYGRQAQRRCAYCGAYVWGRRVACFLHIDLVELDPKYQSEQVAA